ncbi:Siderophore iron transporter mirB [Talaromyces islandicus]|uniref:Siderophore iron transporter mirB n=1 Tax=Talaromyces islandicus TaxID=28573 RepID=A0A0U1LMB0_TALIS|nr:Siderophore iron transporter mirB [Talaromyces islandicus]
MAHHEQPIEMAPHESEDVSKNLENTASYQEGVQQVEAITQVWSKRALWITFALLYVVSFVDSLMEATQTQLTPYVTSTFSEHALLSTTNVISTIVGGVAALPVAKIINIWGRVEGFTIMILLIVVGLITKAVCHNVETYAAAQTIFWIGHIGLGYIIDVFLADMTTLQGRMLIFGINATPSIATTFSGPAIAQDYLDGSTWRWTFGTFAIVMPTFAIPVLISFILNRQKAKRHGLMPERESGRSSYMSVRHYVREFDVFGILLTTAGFALILLPLSLASSSASKWQSGHIIVMLVIGVCCLIEFVVWERWFVPIPYLPWKYLKDRTILASCVCFFALFTSIYCWDIYFSSYLQVVNQQSVKNAGYILNSYSLASSVFSPLVGFLIQRTGRFKWLGMAAIPFSALGTGLLVYFRHPGAGIGYLVMCQIFNGVAGAIVPLCTQMAVMVSVGHNEVAVVLALHTVFGSMGAAIGLAISGAIWTNTLPRAIHNHLPEAQKDQYMTIYSSLKTQLSYKWGSPVREAIVAAYGDTQRLLAVTGACFIPLMFIMIFAWKDLDVRRVVQTRGNVF